MLRNEKLAPIIPRLKYLGENGITIHSQVVLCPKINDGGQLAQTIDELAGLHPLVETLAVVPVGLTKYRGHLAKLRTYNKEEAGKIIGYVNSRQSEFRKRLGTRFVWPSDEFYVIGGEDFPPITCYEEMNQFENGIGMVREFINKFSRRRHQLKGIKSDKRALLVTGASAYSFLNSKIMPYLTNVLGLHVEFDLVNNRFWGHSVTISGLLTGQDLLRHARKHSDRFDALVLPPNCLNNDNLFLDNLSLEQFRNALGKPVHVGQYDLAATIKDVFQ